MKPLTKKNEKQELEFVMMCLAVVCACGVLTEILRLALVVMDYAEGMVEGWALVIRCINLAVSAVCGTLVFLILREVKHRRVFTLRNAGLVSYIGCAAIIGGIVQNIVVNVAINDSMAYNTGTTYLILGVFITFVSCLFRIGIRMKEEQDLTV